MWYINKDSYGGANAMKSRYCFFVVALLLMPLIFACNIYSPFTSVSSDQDRIEEAMKCLHSGDYDCAIEEYKGITDETLKNQKLCMAYMAKAGFGLNALINTFSEDQSHLLGNLANSLIPWSEARRDAADNGKIACAAYEAATKTGFGGLLKALSNYVDCSVRVAKTDLYVATSSSDLACNTPGNADGKVTKADISESSDGSIGAGYDGMCPADVSACGTDMIAASAAMGGSSEFKDIGKASSDLPADLKNAAVDEATQKTVRNAIRGEIAQ